METDFLFGLARAARQNGSKRRTNLRFGIGQGRVPRERQLLRLERTGSSGCVWARPALIAVAEFFQLRATADSADNEKAQS